MQSYMHEADLSALKLPECHSGLFLNVISLSLCTRHDQRVKESQEGQQTKKKEPPSSLICSSDAEDFHPTQQTSTATCGGGADTNCSPVLELDQKFCTP